MLVPTAIMAGIALILFAWATARGQGQNVAALKSAFRMLFEILPMLVFAFVIAGLVIRAAP